MRWGRKGKDPTKEPFGTAVVDLQKTTDRQIEGAEGLDDPQRIVLRSAAMGAAVALGGYGTALIEREKDADVDALPANTGEMVPILTVHLARALSDPVVIEAAFRVVTWSIVSDFATFFWRPNYDLEINECTTAYGPVSTYENTVVVHGKPTDDKSEVAEGNRRRTLCEHP